MSTEVYEDTELYTIEYDGEIDAVVFSWDQFASGGEYREGCEALLDAIRRRGATKLLTDTRGIRAHDAEDQAWMQQEWIPRAQDAGLESSATVHPDSVVSEMDVEKLVDGVDDSAHELLVTSDPTEARRWLAEQ